MNQFKLLLSICLLLTYVTYAHGEDEYDDGYYDDYWCDSYVKHKCLANNKGYTVYRCSDEEKRWDVDRVVQCPENKPGCECGMDSNDDWTCRCYNPTKKPDFPATGVISWNGTFVFEDTLKAGKPKTSYTPGEVHLDSRGRYLLKKTIISERGTKKTVKFDIIIPSSIKGLYVLHTGDTGSKKCVTSETKTGGNLRSIWRDYGHGRTYYRLAKETSHQQKNYAYIQKWTQKVVDDYENIDWEFILEYDSKKGVAIPLRYNAELSNVWYNRKVSVNYMYTYTPIKQDEESFRLEDYCDV